MTFQIPVYITIQEVANILRWSRKRTRRWLLASNALVQRGGEWVTTAERLRDAFPEVWAEMLDKAEEREEAS